MTKPLKDVGASVRAKLLQLAKQRGDDFQLVLLRYANERLLYRLANSTHANRFVLKGAALFTVWTGRPHRATRDLDLLGYGESSEDNVRDVFKDVVAVKTVDDGVVFDAASLQVGPIREDQWLPLPAAAVCHRKALAVQALDEFRAQGRADAPRVKGTAEISPQPMQLPAGTGGSPWRHRRPGGGVQLGSSLRFAMPSRKATTSGPFFVWL